MLYAKMIDDKRYEFAPMNYMGFLNFNKDENLMKQYGYKPFIKAELPDNDRQYRIVYEDLADKIIEKIVFTETDDELKRRAYYGNKSAFEQDFFYLPPVKTASKTIFGGGYYRKKPKGYTSAIESINTVARMVELIGKLPQSSLIFYNKPDFYNDKCLEDDNIISCQFVNNEMTVDEFKQFYIAFINEWNTKNHL